MLRLVRCRAYEGPSDHSEGLTVASGADLHQAVKTATANVLAIQQAAKDLAVQLAAKRQAGTTVAAQSQPSTGGTGATTTPTT